MAQADVLTVDMRARDRASKEIDKVTKSIREMQVRAQLTRKSVDEMAASMRPMSGALSSVGKGFAAVRANLLPIAAGATAATLAIDGLLTRAMQVENTRRAFVSLGGGVADAAERLQGLVTSMDLMGARNKSIQLGLGLTDEQFAEVAEGAAKLGQALGQDVGKSLDDLFVGLGRQSKMILDNLGITLNVEQAYQKFAASVGKAANELDDAEKRAAFTAEALEQLREKSASLTLATDSAATAWGRLKVALSEAADGFAVASSESGIMTTVLDKFTGAFARVGEVLSAGEQKFKSIKIRNEQVARAAKEAAAAADDQGAAIFAAAEKANEALLKELDVEMMIAESRRENHRKRMEQLRREREEWERLLASAKVLPPKPTPKKEFGGSRTPGFTQEEFAGLGEERPTFELPLEGLDQQMEASLEKAGAFRELMLSAYAPSKEQLDERFSEILEQFNGWSVEAAEAMNVASRATVGLNESLNEIAKTAVVQMMVDAIYDMTQALIQLAVTGEASFTQLAATMLRNLGTMAVNMGAFLIGTGIGIEKLKALKGAAAVVAGAALVALGAALHAGGGFVGNLGGNSASGVPRGGNTETFRSAGPQAEGGGTGEQRPAVVVQFSGQPIHTKEEVGAAVEAAVDSRRQASRSRSTRYTGYRSAEYAR